MIKLLMITLQTHIISPMTKYLDNITVNMAGPVMKPMTLDCTVNHMDVRKEVLSPFDSSRKLYKTTAVRELMTRLHAAIPDITDSHATGMVVEELILTDIF